MSTTKLSTVKSYQTYSSSIANHKVIMPNGKVLRVTSHKYITDKPDEIEFLNNEIDSGLFPFMKKGELISSEDLDPMAALRKKIIAEHEAKKAAIQVEPNISSSTVEVKESVATKLSPASSVALAALAAKSNAASAAK